MTLIKLKRLPYYCIDCGSNAFHWSGQPRY